MMNLQKVFQDFNPSKFLVYTCLLVFTVMLALRMDGTIKVSYWTVFMPLYMWKTAVVAGALVGSIVWARNPEYRLSETSYIHFKSMLISLSLQLLLLMFELLVCDKLESGRHLWTLAFIPLIFISLLSIAICVWSLKNDRGFEMELFCSINLLQFVFIALRLDKFIIWSWVVVFVPFWIVMCLAIIAVLYALIFAAILLRTPEVAAEQRRASFHSAVSYSLITLPLLLFLVLLSNKLDHNAPRNFTFGPIMQLTSSTPAPNLPTQIELSYFVVCLPLYFAFTILIFLSFGSRGGNLWWFGMRKDFCSFLLSICPCLREYGNISYSKHSARDNNNTELDQGSTNNRRDWERNAVSLKLSNQPKKTCPAPAHISIESPD
ncbi:putative transmembrane protein [Halotydeus destructor]|nr:putative transmembrane protein [Halotydeus destructor]